MDKVTCEFRFAMGARVRWAGEPETNRCYVVVARQYEERQILGPVVTYLIRAPYTGQGSRRAYEADLELWEDQG